MRYNLLHCDQLECISPHVIVMTIEIRFHSTKETFNRISHRIFRYSLLQMRSKYISNWLPDVKVDAFIVIIIVSVIYELMRIPY